MFLNINTAVTPNTARDNLKLFSTLINGKIILEKQLCFLIMYIYKRILRVLDVRVTFGISQLKFFCYLGEINTLPPRSSSFSSPSFWAYLFAPLLPPPFISADLFIFLRFTFYFFLLKSDELEILTYPSHHWVIWILRERLPRTLTFRTTRPDSGIVVLNHGILQRIFWFCFFFLYHERRMIERKRKRYFLRKKKKKKIRRFISVHKSEMERNNKGQYTRRDRSKQKVEEKKILI